MNKSAFTETTILKNYTILIDDREMLKEDIQTIDISWSKDSFSVSGSILIRDNLDLGNLLPLNGNNKIQIYTEDSGSSFYFKTFVLTKVTDVREQNKFKIYRFDFIDIVSYSMMNTYVGKSFASVKTSDIINDYFSTYGWDDLLETTVSKDFTNTTITHDYLVVPQDRNFLEFIQYQLMKEGYTFYQTRDKLILKSKADLTPDNLDTLDFVYTQLHPRAEYLFKIHEYKTVYNNVLDMNLSNPYTISSYYDFDSKSIPTINSNLDSNYSKLSLNTLELDLQQTNGTKLNTQSEYTAYRDMYKNINTYQHNVVVEVVVPGSNKYNKIYQNANLEFVGNLEHIKGQNEGDVAMSGLYTCVEMHDKIIGGKMLQKLIFIRVDLVKG